MTGRTPLYLVYSVVLALLATGMAFESTALPAIFLAVLAVAYIGLMLLDATIFAAEAPSGAEPDDALPIGFGRALIEKLPTALVVVSDRGRIDYANPAAERMLPHLRTGDHFANLMRAPRFVEAVNAAIAHGSDRTVTFDMPGSGRTLDAQVTYLPHGVDLGTGGQVIVQFDDLTEARKADEMRKDFIANASHELRTPLASIIGYIETLQGHAKDDPEAQDRFLTIMSSQAARMNRLVEDLMSLTRIEMRSHIPPEDRIDICALVRDAATALTPVAQKASATLEVDLPLDGGPQVIGAWDELTQVATNLMDNAIKYGGNPGHVTVSLAKPNEKYPRAAGISIRDTGAGISRENLHRLTERFYRVDTTESRNRGGTGLGLAIVKHVMAHHSGALQIESVAGEGSTFTFWVPLSQTAPDSPLPAAEAEKN